MKGNLKNKKEKRIRGGKVEIEFPQVMENSEIPIWLFNTADVTIIVIYTEVT